jgi:hypothetical protein
MVKKIQNVMDDCNDAVHEVFIQDTETVHYQGKFEELQTKEESSFYKVPNTREQKKGKVRMTKGRKFKEY